MCKTGLLVSQTLGQNPFGLLQPFGGQCLNCFADAAVVFAGEQSSNEVLCVPIIILRLELCHFES